MGAPNSAMISSPMNLSIVPPYFWTIGTRRSKQALMSRRTSSGSSFSLKAVNPAISANKIVTSFRSSSVAPLSASGRSWESCSRSAAIAESTTASPSVERCASNAAIDSLILSALASDMALSKYVGPLVLPGPGAILRQPDSASEPFLAWRVQAVALSRLQSELTEQQLKEVQQWQQELDRLYGK